MKCRYCSTDLERPGDYCPMCHKKNSDSIAVEITRSKAIVYILYDGEVLGKRIIKTRPMDDKYELKEIRNFVDRITDSIHRKKPEKVYLSGNKQMIDRLKEKLHYNLFHVYLEDQETLIEAIKKKNNKETLENVQLPPKEKIGGKHSTILGDRKGKNIIYKVAEHKNVKKIIPGPIDGSGHGSKSGIKGKITRSGNNGNLRLLIRTGSSVQENRVVTTAENIKQGTQIRKEINKKLKK